MLHLRFLRAVFAVCVVLGVRLLHSLIDVLSNVKMVLFLQAHRNAL